jgi:hypothetical protein
MGDRSVITVVSKHNTVSLYGHWAGTTNLEAVRNVLGSSDVRIGDPSTLIAHLFYEFAVNIGNYNGGTGYAIAEGSMPFEWLDNPTVIVNADNGEYCLEGEESMTEFARYDKVVH